MQHKTTPSFTYQGRTFRCVGTFRTANGWEHDVQDIETKEVKRKLDSWVVKAMK
jgi:hypothetical protein